MATRDTKRKVRTKRTFYITRYRAMSVAKHRIINGARISPPWDISPRDHGEMSSPERQQPGPGRPLDVFTGRGMVTTPPTTYDRYSTIHPPIALEPIGELPRQNSSNGSKDPFMSYHNSRLSDPGMPLSLESDHSMGRMKKMNNQEHVDSIPRFHLRRKPGNRDEFDGPTQLLRMPSPGPAATEIPEKDLPHLPTSLNVQEQVKILCDINDRLSRCAFDFVAKYQFPIPLEPEKSEVRAPEDREWTEWVHLLRRLATKRRIPARVLYDGQIKQFITVLENSLEMRHTAKNQSRPLRDDRNILQLISAGTQVAKILKDAPAMEYFDFLYSRTERQIHERRNHTPSFF
ncbi:hypothetical protein TRV_01654 [Trichophyton verrucosum HKI 0517]|uniref:Uncharacterized protein n=1 Tax=Trichophyton verrucosum (strain HKI 0517) TaxID=663202 RepID=D4D3J4_TRIVH|nr:uncharacterized protein TRV_01654 [Trichophyton verrucosum HKI 0517]EFE43544.1 hypothetical protein TRV_01654 [Trichophyton verrucosum HKI 0517]